MRSLASRLVWLLLALQTLANSSLEVLAPGKHGSSLIERKRALSTKQRRGHAYSTSINPQQNLLRDRDVFSLRKIEEIQNIDVERTQGVFDDYVPSQWIFYQREPRAEPDAVYLVEIQYLRVENRRLVYRKSYEWAKYKTWVASPTDTLVEDHTLELVDGIGFEKIWHNTNVLQAAQKAQPKLPQRYHWDVAVFRFVRRHDGIPLREDQFCWMFLRKRKPRFMMVVPTLPGSKSYLTPITAPIAHILRSGHS